MRWALPLLCVASCASPPRPAQEPYRFTLNGRPFLPRVLSLNGTPEDPRPGDVLGVLDWYFVLGDERGGDLSSTSHLLRLDGRVIAVRVEQGAKDDLTCPLDDMTPDEIRGLRGIRLNTWDDAIEGALALANPTKLCVIIDDLWPLRHRGRVPPFFRGLRYFMVRPQGRFAWGRSLPREEDYIGPELELLAFHRPLDAARLARCGRLRYADLSRPEDDLMSNDMAPASAFAMLGELRVLDIAGTSALTDLGWAAVLPHLRHLNVSRSDITSLSGIEGHPSLCAVYADQTKVGARPAPMARMQVSLRQSPVSPEAHGLDDVDRVIIRTGGRCHRFFEQEVRQFEETDLGAIHQLLPILEEGRVARDIMRCGCCGGPTLEFCRGDAIVCSVTIHHGVLLASGWRGLMTDTELTPESAGAIGAWVDARLRRE